jgi:hypothetical protein
MFSSGILLHAEMNRIITKKHAETLTFISDKFEAKIVKKWFLFP